MTKRYITTTLPYINSKPHIGHCFEFCLADVIADFERSRLGKDNVFLNVGVDEHGTKVAQKAAELGISVEDYCIQMEEFWQTFCHDFKIEYNNFYRTRSELHKQDVLRFFGEIKEHLYTKTYSGKYCVGCESFKTEKEIVDSNYCSIHTNIELTDIEEENIFFKLSKFNPDIKDILVDKTLSTALKNLLNEDYDLSVTRKNVEWGVKLSDEETIYVWFDALLNYIFALGYYQTPDKFKEYWANSLQICGKDNLKFQAQIFQAMLLAHDIPQTTELLIHGTILDDKGNKMSKSLGNVIDPYEQLNKFGLAPVKYYLTFGLSTTGDSKYSETELINQWNNDIVNGFGNLVSRTLHLVDIKNVDVSECTGAFLADYARHLRVDYFKILKQIKNYDLNGARLAINERVWLLNKRFNDERPFAKDCENYVEIIQSIYIELRTLGHLYSIILKDQKDKINEAFKINKKVILFQPL